MKILKFNTSLLMQFNLTLCVQKIECRMFFLLLFLEKKKKKKKNFFSFFEGVATSGVLVHVQYNSIVNGNCCIILLYYIFNGSFLHPNKINRSFKRLKATPNKSTIFDIKILLLPTGTNTLSLAAWTNH